MEDLHTTPGHRRAACPKCRENFSQGEIRVGSAAAGNKANFHMLCLDAALPDVTQMTGWNDLTRHEQGTAQTLYSSHRSARGGDAEVQAPKRPRQTRPTRSVQMQLPFATPAQASAILRADLDAAAPEDSDPEAAHDSTAATPLPLPTYTAADALLDEDSDLDDVDNLPPADGDPLVNMEWWDYVGWDQLLEHTAVTMINVPRALTFSVALWRSRVSRHILAQATDEDKRRGWKLFLALDLLLFGDVREEEGQHSKTRHISDRMADMDAGRWSSVWNQVGQRQPSDRVASNDAESTAKRVRSLMAVKEISRAASAVWGPSEPRTSQQVIHKFSTTQPAEPPARYIRPGGEPMSQDLRDRLRKELQKGFKSFPRKSGSGPCGSRYEHWGPLAYEDILGGSVADCLLKTVEGDMPRDALDAFLSAYLVGIGKKEGGTRVLGQGGTPRRKMGRAIAKVLAQPIQQAAGPHQYGLRKDGASALHRLITAHAAVNPGTGVVSLDIADAFTAVDREAALNAVSTHCPELYQLVIRWLDRASKHVVPGEAGETPSV